MRPSHVTYRDIRIALAVLAAFISKSTLATTLRNRDPELTRPVLPIHLLGCEVELIPRVSRLGGWGPRSTTPRPVPMIHFQDLDRTRSIYVNLMS